MTDGSHTSDAAGEDHDPGAPGHDAVHAGHADDAAAPDGIHDPGTLDDPETLDPDPTPAPGGRPFPSQSASVPAALEAELARPTPDMLMIATRPDGVIALQGPPKAVDTFTEQIERVLGSPKLAQATQYASMLGSGVDALPGVGEDSPQVFQFSQRAMDLLRRNGLIGTEDGVFGAAANAVSNTAEGIPDWLPLPAEPT